MLNEKIKEVEKRLCKEFDELLAKPTWTPQELEYANKLVDMAKDSITIDAMNEHTYDDRSYGHEPYSYLMHEPQYNDGGSMRRGRSPMTGRYVSRDAGYDDRRSGHSITDRMVDSLERIMDQAQTEYERNEIRAEIDHLRRTELR